MTGPSRAGGLVTRQAAVVTVPSGTVTFLFTDIEGSTGLWEAVPDAMRLALARHDDIVRSCIEARSGYVLPGRGSSPLRFSVLGMPSRPRSRLRQGSVLSAGPRSVYRGADGPAHR